MLQRTPIILLSILFLGITWSTGSPFIHNKVVAHHTEIEDTLYQYDRYVAEERYETASIFLSQHKQELAQLFANQSADIEEELVSLLELNTTIINDESFPKQYKSNQAQSLLLAVDSIQNQNDPIWLKWKSNLESTLSNYLDSEQVTEQQVEKIMTEYQIIQPALRVALDEEQYNELATSYEQLRESETVTGDSAQLKAVFRQTQLLDISTDSGSQTGKWNFIWMMSVVGGFITLTLSYVTWKKYKGEKKSEKQTIN
ncbi:sporulation protein YpjB [Aquibacillus rhizosphaerae]|uniref:Sporulation protein YpjB n=1 Tax=Aquibacillus rhizosphaerae TaxID=3051431 RepID=A0ABT7L6G8_9BACI|nr:sporulation protein YpjB [Aquibacillus sp. LR5S19]MDL4840817.1 sporulation protein YpjB [Aquibacillus sp. LR5S19]